jgi:hypothetical protein
VKPHYHHDFVGVFFTSLEVMLIWHGIRFIASRAAGSSNAMVSQVATAVGGAFTFGGHP